MKDAVSRKRDMQKAVCQDNTEENMRKYKGMKNRAKKPVPKAMRKKAEEALT